MKARSTKHETRSEFHFGFRISCFGFSAKQGYTLIELIVAVGLFALVMTLASGAYLIMMGLSRETQASATGINNLAFALETMTRSIRTGTAYACGAFGGDCASGASIFSFVSASGEEITFALSGVAPNQYIERTVSGAASALTDPSSIGISSLMFYVSGSASAAEGDYAQPYVTIALSGSVSGKPGESPESFAIETSASMRAIDLTVEVQAENPPAPTCTLAAEPASILAGGSSVLSWVAGNATTFSINQGIGGVTPAAAGSYSVSPQATTVYTGTAANTEGSATCSAQVTIL